MTILTIPMSEEYKRYTDSLEDSLESIYAVAREARKKGLDPALVPEPEVAKDLASRGGSWKKEYLVDVPVWIVVCHRLTVPKGFDESAFASTWCAIENMLLAATAEGLGCCPYTLADGEEQAIRGVLPIPEDHRIAGIVHIGHTDAKLKAPKRREFKAIVGYDKFP